nr:immunoglobulin heavy chain junction region [Mus musculus]MBK4187415.1 immunoglobulin heavy chain junction region [Mus musculus]
CARRAYSTFSAMDFW